MDKETKKEFENLAVMVKKGFDETNNSIGDLRDEMEERFEQVDKRFEQVDKRFEQVDRHFVNVNARLDTIERDIAEIRRHFVYRDEFEDLMGRVKYLEQKLGIDSGK
ncbi:MAG: hypothetical protein KJ977_02010 [Candidatus Omnitrophica bacterium]|nr:hypothetical protein [Candidatus Omnitrophota bacterium]